MALSKAEAAFEKFAGDDPIGREGMVRPSWISGYETADEERDAQYPRLAAEIERQAEVIRKLRGALKVLIRACDTLERNVDGTQRGIRMPERSAIDQARAALDFEKFYRSLAGYLADPVAIMALREALEKAIGLLNEPPVAEVANGYGLLYVTTEARAALEATKEKP